MSPNTPPPRNNGGVLGEVGEGVETRQVRTCAGT